MRNTKQGTQVPDEDEVPMLQHIMEMIRAFQQANDDHRREQDRLREKAKPSKSISRKRLESNMIGLEKRNESIKRNWGTRPELNKSDRERKPKPTRIIT